MTISYDPKFQGLSIELEEKEFKKISEEILMQPEAVEYKNHIINHISYRKKSDIDEENDSKFIIVFVIYCFLGIFGTAILALGFFRFYEIARDLML